MNKPSKRLPGSAVVLMTAFALAIALPAARMSAASPKACKVRNVSRGTSHGSLAAAVKKARQHNKLTVRGKCTGKTKIQNKKLKIVGVRTSRSGPPTLRGNGRAPVLKISGDGVNVTLKRLTIEGKPGQVVDHPGGGVFLFGKLTLENVKIRDFETTRDGGGIYIEDGTVRLLGTTVIRGNHANAGGGIYNRGARVIMEDKSLVERNSAAWGGGIHTAGLFSLLKMTGHSSVHDNMTEFDGGGVNAGTGETILKSSASVSGNKSGRDGGGLIVTGGGKLTLEGSSRVADNTSVRYGGGVFMGADTLTMRDSATVTGNTALVGGGINSQSWATLVGVVCPPDGGANVTGNSPTDCVHG